ncbi:MAG: NADPH-dependent oxidoreductase [Tissierellia bacterium]|nr:NADPH-dependent oxidoreductase [Tissierellia bacterium]
MNQTIATQKLHRTIRAFKEGSLSEDIIKELLEVARRTATSTGLQSASIIRVKDQKKRNELAKVSGQPYVASSAELWIFIVDTYRNQRIAEQKGVNTDAGRDMDRFFQGFSDGAFMAQNVLNALESLELGGVYLGSLHNDDRRVIEILELPELTFPIIGLSFGEKDQSPQLKPKMDMSLRCFEDVYKIEKDYLEIFKDYDEEMQTYYDLRDANNRVDSFTNQIATQYANPSAKRNEILDIILEQGYTLNPRL